MGKKMSNCIDCGYEHGSIPEGEMCLACIHRKRGWSGDGDVIAQLQEQNRIMKEALENISSLKIRSDIHPDDSDKEAMKISDEALAKIRSEDE